jgi:hypothetical protein
MASMRIAGGCVFGFLAATLRRQGNSVRNEPGRVAEHPFEQLRLGAVSFAARHELLRLGIVTSNLINRCDRAKQQTTV